MREVTIKKLTMGTEEFRRANYSVVVEDPQYCWDAFWRLLKFSAR